MIDSNNLSIIVFSKDRSLQLQGYIESLIYFSKINSNCITVLYKDSEKVSYTKLFKDFPNINWVKENLFFEDLFSNIKKSKEYIMFGCDDVIFKDHIDFNYALNVLLNNNDIFGFSLRLGKNIIPLPKQLTTNDKHIEWNWKNTDLDSWNYPWELDSTIYRKNDVLDILTNLNKLEIKNPNFLESEVAFNKIFYVQKEYLSSFNISKSIVITINRVQDNFQNRYDDSFKTDIETLHGIYNKGAKIDFLKISKLKNKKIHVGARFFKIIGSNEYNYSLVQQIKTILNKFKNLLK